MLRLALSTIVVDDYDAAIAWFVGMLGFVLSEDTPLPPDKRWVVVTPPGGGAGLLLARAATPAQAAAVGYQSGGRVSFFLHTDAFDRDHRVMTARGVVFVDGPRAEVYGQVAVFVDICGNRWDLVEAA